MSSDAFAEARAAFFAGLERQGAGEFAEAERHYRASLRLVPGRASTLINLAAVQLRMARPGDALASADAALAAEPDSTDALLHRAPHQADHGSTLVQEEPDVASWLGCQRDGFGKRLQRLPAMSLRVVRQGLQHADLERAPGASR